MAKESTCPLDYLDDEYIDKDKEVFHDMINKVFELSYLNKDTHISHEWYFISVFMKLIENDNKLAEQFVMFVMQYYSNYRWIDFNINDYLGTVVVECSWCNYNFLAKTELGDTSEFPLDLGKAMLFGEMVTSFLIRFCGYSLIKSSGEKIIITARNDCNKRFEDLLYDGYSLQRMKRIIYKDVSNLPYFGG